MIHLKTSTLSITALITLALIGYVALSLAYPAALAKEHLLDFDIFYLVSTMIGEGNLAEAYATDTFLSRQTLVPGFDGGERFWSYPPHFNLIVLPLSALPISVSYAVFMIVTLVFYVFAIRALAGSAFHTVLVLFFPLVLLIIRSGQNSFITGGLITLTCFLALRNSRWAGFPLGLMIIKPHLALGVGIWSLLDRRWWLAALSFLVIGGVSLIATLVFGAGVWETSLMAIADTADVLREGRFPLFRMTSIYAFALSFGWGHQTAMILHVISVVMALAALIVLGRAKLPPQVFLGAGVFVSGLVSPYNYDYDLAMLAAAACLLFETVRNYAIIKEKVFIGAVTLGLGGHALLLTFIFDKFFDDKYARPVSVMGPLLLVCGYVLFRIIWRSRKTN